MEQLTRFCSQISWICFKGRLDRFWDDQEV